MGNLSPEMQSTIISYGAIVFLLVILYFFMIRPQRKRDKETAAMRSAIEVGDEIVTIGGIVGTVVSMREDTIVIESGSDRNKIRILRSAVNTNNTAAERLAERKKAAQTEKKEKKEKNEEQTG